MSYSRGTEFWSSPQEDLMSDHVYKKIEVVGSSSESITDAIDNAISTACSSIDHVGWFEVSEIRGHVENGRVGHFQVTTKIGFRLEKS
jgi:flavin-binding protein dodecin